MGQLAGNAIVDRAFTLLAAMPKMPWIDFTKAYPDAHVVAGFMGDATGPPVREACNLLAKLAARHHDGAFAVTIRRDSGTTAVVCALADPAAAARLAEVLGARATDGVAGYRTFDFDGAAIARIRATADRAPPARSARRRPPGRPP